MSNELDGMTADNTTYGSYGEFIPENMTDDEWRDYDAHVAAEIDAFDAAQAAEYEAFADFYDYEPSPYDGTYSEM